MEKLKNPNHSKLWGFFKRQNELSKPQQAAEYKLILTNQNRKSVHELDAQLFITLIEMVVMISISFILPLWLSKDISIQDVRYKTYVTLGVLFLLTIIITILLGKFNQKKQQIMRLK